jgi:hypothetical protein
MWRAEFFLLILYSFTFLVLCYNFWNMITLASQLLGVATSLLLAIQGQPNVSTDVSANALRLASQSIQLSALVAVYDAKNAQSASTNIWPSANRLANSKYLDRNGNLVSPGGPIAVMDSYTSFGDLNGDGLDDAAVIIREVDEYVLAGMVNQSGILFNTARLPLGKSLFMYDHRITDGVLKLDVQLGGGARKVFKYKLLGGKFIEI